MTRINTNVSSLVAQKTLSRSNAELSEALTRLSTGLRINVGKDDPAGLIASEALRSDIISTEKAITNSERASQLISTADSALGQVSQLLNDIRGLVSEAANTGALSSDQIEANQLQIDSSLEAIDRIAQITSFQGRKLLDGSLDFLTQGVDNTKVQDLKVDQANFGSLSAIDVSVDIVSQATRGQLDFSFGSVSEDVVLEVGGSNGTEVFNFANGSSIKDIATAVNLVSDSTGIEAIVAEGATQGQITVSSLGLDNDVVLTANEAGFDPGNVQVKFTEGNTTATAVNFSASNGTDPATLDVALRTTAAVQASADVDGDTGTLTAASVNVQQSGANNDLTFTASSAGANGNDIRIVFVDNPDNVETVAYDETNRTLTVGVDSGVTTANEVINLIQSDATVSQHVTVALDSSVETTNTGAGTIVTDIATTSYYTTGGTGDTNNTLNIEAAFAGTAFNGANVHIVNGDGTALGVTSANSVAATRANAIFTGVAASEFDITARRPGAEGNDIQINIATADLGATDAATVDVSGSIITLTLNSNGSGTSNLSTVAAAFDGNAEARDLVIFNATGTGSTDVAGTSDTKLNLTGGGVVTTSNEERIEYAATGRAAKAALTFAGADNDIVLTAASTGTSFNDVKVAITKDLTSGTATASYDSTNKILTIHTRTDNSTTGQNIVDAVNNSVSEFSAAADTSVETTNTLAGTVSTASNANFANTNNTGGDANTLFIHI
ncbi:MAG: flagellin, partial [Pirellulaceae bacterium]|nr:flagellin [Pirellulaceae bacterium]